MDNTGWAPFVDLGVGKWKDKEANEQDTSRWLIVVETVLAVDSKPEVNIRIAFSHTVMIG